MYLGRSIKILTRVSSTTFHPSDFWGIRFLSTRQPKNTLRNVGRGSQSNVKSQEKRKKDLPMAAPSEVKEPPEIDLSGCPLYSENSIDTNNTFSSENTKTRQKCDHRPGYQRALVAKLQEMIAVDLAGETAAVRICQAHQFFYPGNSVVGEILDEEQNHFDIMTEWARKYSVPNSLLDPIFYLTSVALGGFTALLGPKAMMCCHAAIEEVITEHYNDQLREIVSLESIVDSPNHATIADCSSDAPLKEQLSQLRKTVKQLRDDEQHHHQLGIDHGGKDFLGASVLYNLVKGVCKVGIFLAKRF